MTSPDLRPIGQVAREAGIPRTTYRTAIDAGLIHVVPDRCGPGKGGGLAVTPEEALFIAAVAAAAVLLGVAFLVLLRVARATGAQLTPSGALDLGTVSLN